MYLYIFNENDQTNAKRKTVDGTAGILDFIREPLSFLKASDLFVLRGHLFLSASISSFLYLRSFPPFLFSRRGVQYRSRWPVFLFLRSLFHPPFPFCPPSFFPISASAALFLPFSCFHQTTGGDRGRLGPRIIL